MNGRNNPISLPVATGRRDRVIWLQNSPDHYFVQMLDALNSRGDVEYFGVFLCPPPTGNVLHQIPTDSPHVFLGDPVNNAGDEGHRRLGPQAQQYIRKLDFTAAIVGGYDSRFKRWVFRYCRSRGIRVAIIADSNIRAERGATLKKKAKRFAKRVFLRGIISRVDYVITCNRSGVAYWRYYGCPVSKIARSTYFCTVDPIAAAMASRKELFERYRLNPKRKLVFTAARMLPVKALHLMVDAFKGSGLGQQGWAWAVAGDGPLRQELERRAGELNGDAIRFLGRVAPDDIPALMAQSELFVLPSLYEPHGIVVEESIAVGTPVIAGDGCGAARDLVRADRTGWLFKSGDAADLLRVLTVATSDQGKLTGMRSSCVEGFGIWYAKYSPVLIIPEIVKRWL